MVGCLLDVARILSGTGTRRFLRPGDYDGFIFGMSRRLALEARVDGETSGPGEEHDREGGDV